MMTTKKERKLRGFETLMLALATEDAKHMRTTAEMEQAVDRLYAGGRQLMAELNYTDAVKQPVKIEKGTVRPSIVAMARDAVIASIAQIRAMHTDLACAWRDGEVLSDDDLRRLLEDALRLTEDKQ